MIENQQTRKSYNPFKMWGSWVGLLFGVIGSILYFVNIGYDSIKLIVAPFMIPYLIIFGCWAPSGTICEQIVVVKILGIITSLIAYFLIGWAIHSLVRRLRR
ncbi:MAG: hypothetical protein V1788_00345 [Nanoarchaeota archaeon]